MMGSGQLHESFSRSDEDAQSSERSFGIVFAALFALLGVYNLVTAGGQWIVWMALAALFLVLACFWTTPLRPLASLWHRFGLLLFRVVNPVIMAVLYFVAIVPMGLIMRLAGKDPLQLKLDRECPSYWVHRQPPGPPGQAMKNQF
jgi:hypothetical protein